MPSSRPPPTDRAAYTDPADRRRACSTREAEYSMVGKGNATCLCTPKPRVAATRGSGADPGQQPRLGVGELGVAEGARFPELAEPGQLLDRAVVAFGRRGGGAARLGAGEHLPDLGGCIVFHVGPVHPFVGI